MSSGERDLATLLATMRPELVPGAYVFTTTAGPVPDGVDPVAVVREDEGRTLVVDRAVADRLGLAHDGVWAMVTLRVHSSLEAVGLTAAVATALAEEGISCNVVAGYHHDHLFVPAEAGARTVRVLQALADGRVPPRAPGEGVSAGEREDIVGATPDLWGEQYSTDSATVQRDYDAFAETGTYDETFAAWGYVGPETAAAILRNYVPTGSRVLDAACGSGLTGAAMRALGYTSIDGIDLSPRLLELAARTGAYDRLEQVDMQRLPLPLDDDAYDAVTLIGALTYFETDEVLRDLCRVVRSGGHVVFTQREDLVRDLGYDDRLRVLEDEGVWRRTFGTEPMPYLPHHPEYGTRIRVQYFVYEVV
jgi:SAM-dependent methyltransferase